MQRGLTLPGQQRPDDNHWNNNILAKCHWDDRLWGYACRVSEELHTHSVEDFTNPVLFQLLFMGTYNWSNEDCCNDQSTQAMRHSTIMGSHLYQVIQSLTTEVCVAWNGGGFGANWIGQHRYFVDSTNNLLATISDVWSGVVDDLKATKDEVKAIKEEYQENREKLIINQGQLSCKYNHLLNVLKGVKSTLHTQEQQISYHWGRTPIYPVGILFQNPQ